MRPFSPQQLYIDQEVRDCGITRNVVAAFPGIVPQYGESGVVAPSISAGKQILHLAKHQGVMVKPCPGTPRHVCCNYFTINFMVQCNLDCSYCILQHYLNNYPLTIHADVENIMMETDALLKKNPRRLFRIGTGELSDSLSLDHITRFSQTMVPFFAQKKNAVFELKTKTDNINQLVGLNHGGRTVISWSLNPPDIIQHEELHTSQLDERLAAARTCQDAGYLVGFHFDPLIHYCGWERDYREVVEMLFEAVIPGRIAWISLGCLRFHKTLKPIIEERFPGSRILNEEFISGSDGKMRYLKALRIKLFSALLGWIRSFSDDVFVYLCMERSDVWKRAFGYTPGSNRGLDELFQKNLERKIV